MTDWFRCQSFIIANEVKLMCEIGEIDTNVRLGTREKINRWNTGLLNVKEVV